MKKILVVDDEKEFNDLLCLRLQKSGGYDAIGVLGGQECLDFSEKTPPDLILLDIMMPKIDGFEVFKRLRANPKTKNIPVVILTAAAYSASEEELLKAGVDDYLAKPFEAKDLLEKISTLLNR